MNNIENIIKTTVDSIHKDFSENPYDYVSYEIEAQVKLYNALKEHITDKMYITNEWFIPPLVNQSTSRIRLGYKLLNYIHDIIIFKPNVHNPTKYDDVEALIEIKIGYGDDKKLLTGPATKDFSILREYNEIGYFIFFIANEFDKTSKNFQDFFIRTFESYKKEYNFKSNHAFVIFRDKIIQ
ncbi:MAG: hypothetical protein WBK20_02600 [Spirochaetota bacterium]